MFDRLRSDIIQCILDCDPAACSTWEVITCYPVARHRLQRPCALVLDGMASNGWGASSRTWGAGSPALKSTPVPSLVASGYSTDHGMAAVIGETAVVTIKRTIIAGLTGRPRSGALWLSWAGDGDECRHARYWAVVTMVLR